MCTHCILSWSWYWYGHTRCGVACAPTAQEDHVSRAYELLSGVFHHIRLALIAYTIAVCSCCIIMHRQLLLSVIRNVWLCHVGVRYHIVYTNIMHMYISCEGDALDWPSPIQCRPRAAAGRRGKGEHPTIRCPRTAEGLYLHRMDEAGSSCQFMHSRPFIRFIYTHIHTCCM